MKRKDDARADALEWVKADLKVGPRVDVAALAARAEAAAKGEIFGWDIPSEAVELAGAIGRRRLEKLLKEKQARADKDSDLSGNVPRDMKNALLRLALQERAGKEWKAFSAEEQGFALGVLAETYNILGRACMARAEGRKVDFVRYGLDWRADGLCRIAKAAPDGLADDLTFFPIAWDGVRGVLKRMGQGAMTRKARREIGFWAASSFENAGRVLRQCLELDKGERTGSDWERMRAWLKDKLDTIGRDAETAARAAIRAETAAKDNKRAKAIDADLVKAFREFDARRKNGGTQMEIMEAGFLDDMREGEGLALGSCDTSRFLKLWREWAGMGRPDAEAYSAKRRRGR